MTKFTWEADKASLVLRVTKDSKTTEWKIRKSTNLETLYQIFNEVAVAVDDYEHTARLTPVYEEVRGGQDAQDRWEAQLAAAQSAFMAAVEGAQHQQTEEESRAAQARLAASKSIGAKWWDNDDDDEPAYVAMLPDYDAGEI